MIDPASRSLARSNLYGLLAIGFRYPANDERAFLISPEYLDSIEECLQACVANGAAEAAAIAADLRTGAQQDDALEAEYLQSFQTNAPVRSASLYESDYRPGLDKAAILLELRAFYEHFGLAISSEFRELEDSLTGELEFMHFLAAKEAQARLDGRTPESYRRAQRDFLERHLSLWMSRLHLDVARKSHSTFYRALSQAAKMLVESDVDELCGELTATGEVKGAS